MVLDDFVVVLHDFARCQTSAKKIVDTSQFCFVGFSDFLDFVS